MQRPRDFRKNVRYELMLGREAREAIQARPLGFLPIGCLERHGDHLPMGLDVIKAHGICCEVARVAGGVVFPAHFYAGIHGMTPEQLRTYTGEWGNIYTDATAEASIIDLIRQIEVAGIRVLVLYSGHYPGCQREMIVRIAETVNHDARVRVIPFSEPFVLTGDHAGVSETSLMLYVDRALVDMTRISERNYKDHGWTEANSPENASVARGESEMQTIIEHLMGEITRAFADRQGSA